jgi:predicted metal-binding protein
MGATDALVITTDAVVIDERVVAKCAYPRCSGYGTNANCPPYAMSPDQTRKVIKNFRYGILAKIEVPPHEIAGPEAIEKNLVAPYIQKINEIVAKIEARAFYDGHYLALAFGSGNCKSIFCKDTDCQALVPGQPCPYRLKARSSMEAVGIDCFGTASKVGWDIYAIGQETLPEEIPYGLRLGLVLIA